MDKITGKQNGGILIIILEAVEITFPQTERVYQGGRKTSSKDPDSDTTPYASDKMMPQGLTCNLL